MFCKECPGDQTERSDIAEGADIKKGAPPEPVNQPEADESENQIGDANADGLQQCGLCAKAGEFKDAGSEVQNRIDARHLVEECNQDGEQDGLLKTSSPEMSGRSLLRRGGCDLVRFGRDLCLRDIRLGSLQDL